MSDDLLVLKARLRALEARVITESERASARTSTMLEILRRLGDDDPSMRRRLAEARASPSYERAWTDPEPLVSIVIPTYKRTDTLVERAVPSVLAQTHANVEVVVVGDAAPPETGRALAELDDPRVRYENLLYNGPYPEDQYRNWLVAGAAPFNHGMRMAGGAWVGLLGDDDAFAPDHIEQLLAAARARRLEYVYGRIRQLMPDGSESLIGVYPPESHQVGLQSAIWLRALTFLEVETVHAYFLTPGDWGLIQRMLRIGVRMGMADEQGTMYWPSGRGGERPVEPEPHALLADDPEGDHAHELATALAESRLRQAEAETAAAELADQVRSSQAAAADARRRLDEVRDSKSWRLTAPLRRIRRKG